MPSSASAILKQGKPSLEADWRLNFKASTPTSSTNQTNGRRHPLATFCSGVVSTCAGAPLQPMIRAFIGSRTTCLGNHLLLNSRHAFHSGNLFLPSSFLTNVPHILETFLAEKPNPTLLLLS
jgi:hypothetical protein